MRLHRVGAKHQPSYRIVVTPALTPRDGSYLDQVGFYNPRTEPATLTIDTDKVVDWLKKGVQPTDRVVRLLESVNIVPESIRKGEPIPTEPIAKKDRSLKPKASDVAAAEPAKEAKTKKATPAAAPAPEPAAASPEPVAETAAEPGELTELAAEAASGTAVEEDLATDGIINESPGSQDSPAEASAESTADAGAVAETAPEAEEGDGTVPMPDPAEAGAAESGDGTSEGASAEASAGDVEVAAEEEPAVPAKTPRKRAAKPVEPAESESE